MFLLPSLLPFLLWLGFMSGSATAWAPSSLTTTTTKMKPQHKTISTTGTLYAKNEDDVEDEDDDTPSNQFPNVGTGDERSEAQRHQEMIFEDMSARGADVIAKMDIPERAKRAMLAEKIEDRIFELTEILEKMVNENDGTIAKNDREKATDLAMQTKQLQLQ